MNQAQTVREVSFPGSNIKKPEKKNKKTQPDSEPRNSLLLSDKGSINSFITLL